MKLRRTVTLTVLLSFIVLSMTGLILFITPQGRVAYWAGWTLFGLSKDQYAQLHTTFMVLFLAAGVWHIVLNWKPITNYMRNKSRETKIFVPEFNLALIFTVVFVLGTLFSMPPFGTLIDAGAGIKTLWERHEGSPPWGHAEQSTLVRFTRGLEDWERLEYQRLVSISMDEAIDSLRAAGFTVDNENQTVIDIAGMNHTTPKNLMDVIRRAGRPVVAGDESLADEIKTASTYPVPMSGLGRLSLVEYAERYGIHVDSILARFRAKGVQIDANVRMKDEADRLGTDPEALIELLNEPL